MEKEKKIFDEGLERFSLNTVYFSNLLIVLWIFLGAIACWFLSPVVSFLYLGISILMVFFILRRLVCVNCYYYDKWCHTGWGKLSVLLFKKGKIENFNTCAGIKIAPITYGLLSLTPVIFLIISLIFDFNFLKLLVLFLLLLFSLFSFIIARQKACNKCKMKYICPGSAVK